MNKYSDYVYYQGTNNPVAGVAVSVYLHNTTTPAVLYTSAGVALPTNIVTTDQTGYFEFYTLTGQYDLYILGALYYTVSINEMTGVPDPLTLTGLTVSGTASIGKILVGGATDDAVSQLQVKGSISCIGSTVTVPYALPASAIRTAGTTAAQTNIREHMFSDTGGSRPAICMSKNTLAGAYPTATGQGVGVFQFGTIVPSTQAFASQAEVGAYTAEAWSDTNRGSTLVFSNTPLGSTTVTERARIVANGNFLIGTTTDDTVNKLQVSGGISGTSIVSSGNLNVSGTTSLQGTGITGALNVTGTSSLARTYGPSDTGNGVGALVSLTDTSAGNTTGSHNGLWVSSTYNGAITGSDVLASIRNSVTLGGSFTTTGSFYGAFSSLSYNVANVIGTLSADWVDATSVVGSTVTTFNGSRTTITCNGAASNVYVIRSVSSIGASANVTNLNGIQITETIAGIVSQAVGVAIAINPTTTSTVSAITGFSAVPTLPATGTAINTFLGFDTAISTSGMTVNGVKGYQARNELAQAATSGGFAYGYFANLNTKVGVVVYQFNADGNAPSRFSGGMIIPGLAIYANNAAAITGGLAVGALYRTGADPDHVCIVH